MAPFKLPATFRVTWVMAAPLLLTPGHTWGQGSGPPNSAEKHPGVGVETGGIIPR